MTQRSRSDGSVSPYEANIALFELFRGDVGGEDEWQVERFLLSQGVMLAFEGVPAVYYNSILASSNDHEGFKKTGRNRTLNRKKWERSEIDQRLSVEESAPHRVHSCLKDMLELRKRQSAFHPESPQRCVQVDRRVFALWRGSSKSDQELLCVFNFSKEQVVLDKESLGLGAGEQLGVCFSQGEVTQGPGVLGLSAYAMAWLEREGSPS